MRKNDRIETVKPYKGKVQTGIVYSISKGKVKMLFDDGESVITGSEKCFQYCNQPLPAALSHSFKKGDRTELEWEGRTVYGIIDTVSLGSAKVVLDGGETIIKCSPSHLRASKMPIAKDTIATPMDAYEVRGYRNIRGIDNDTQAFEATIWRDGKKILVATNNGSGGCNSYYGNVNDETRFYNDTKSWAATFGEKEPFEEDNSWIWWFVHRRPYGLTAADYFLDRSKEFSKLGTPA